MLTVNIEEKLLVMKLLNKDNVGSCLNLDRAIFNILCFYPFFFIS